MLHEFLTSNSTELIKRCRAKVAKRSPEIPAGADQGVPLFLQQLVETLRGEHLSGDRDISAPEPTPARTSIGRTAALHGADLLRRGYRVDQVVHDYGDLCQAVTDLAVEQKKPLTTDEFRTLNRCLDNAIADAVTAYAQGQNDAFSSRAELSQKSRVFSSNEQHRLIRVAIQVYTTLQTGNIGLNGATGTALLTTLCDLRDLIDKYPSA